jgi:hypothetical protein
VNASEQTTSARFRGHATNGGKQIAPTGDTAASSTTAGKPHRPVQRRRHERHREDRIDRYREYLVATRTDRCRSHLVNRGWPTTSTSLAAAS